MLKGTVAWPGLVGPTALFRARADPLFDILNEFDPGHRRATAHRLGSDAQCGPCRVPLPNCTVTGSARGNPPSAPLALDPICALTIAPVPPQSRLNLSRFHNEDHLSSDCQNARSPGLTRLVQFQHRQKGRGGHGRLDRMDRIFRMAGGGKPRRWSFIRVHHAQSCESPLSSVKRSISVPVQV